ncbi:MAG TPA: RDD family protein [Gammaproteobacteria bacterium]|nr:RDD family protein [Gammaproteobacteria bacterium]
MSERLEIDTPDGTPLSLEIAGAGSRSHAFVIDWHIRLLFALAWLAGFGFFFWQPLKQWFNSEQENAAMWPFYVVLLPAGLIYLLYHPVLEILLQGRTPGKRMAGVRIVTLRGETPGAGALLIRNLFRLIDSLPTAYMIGLACALCTRHHVRIGDMAAGTLLVHEEKIDRESLQDATRLAIDSRLAPADQDLLLEILERWKTLERKSRISIGGRFLEKTGAALPAADKESRMEAQIHRQLLKLAGK